MYDPLLKVSIMFSHISISASVVECSFRKPNWYSYIMLCFSIKFLFVRTWGGG